MQTPHGLTRTELNFVKDTRNQNYTYYKDNCSYWTAICTSVRTSVDMYREFVEHKNFYYLSPFHFLNRLHRILK